MKRTRVVLRKICSIREKFQHHSVRQPSMWVSA